MKQKRITDKQRIDFLERQPNEGYLVAPINGLWAIRPARGKDASIFFGSLRGAIDLLIRRKKEQRGER